MVLKASPAIYYAMKKSEIILYSILLFLIVFNPPLLPGFSFTVLFVLMSIFLCLGNMKRIKSIFRDRSIKRLFKAFIVFFVYYAFTTIINFIVYEDDAILTGFITLTWTSMSFFLVTFAIVIIAQKKSMSMNNLCGLYVLAGFYQALIGLACLINPSIKDICNSMVISNSGSEYMRDIVSVTSAFRNFGLASTTYDIFGMSMSILAIASAKKGLEDGWVYYILAGLISIVAIINARTSFFLIAVGLFFLTMSKKGESISVSRIFHKILVYSIFAFCALTIVFTVIKDTSTEQLLWLASAVEDATSLSGGEKTGYFDILFNEFLVFPSSIFSVLFGVGMSPADAINHNSDVGYIQYLWLFGIVGSILYYRFYYILFRTARNNASWPNNAFFLATLWMTIIYLIKLTCLGYSMASVIFGPLCIYSILRNEKVMGSSKFV